MSSLFRYLASKASPSDLNRCDDLYDRLALSSLLQLNLLKFLNRLLLVFRYLASKVFLIIFVTISMAHALEFTLVNEGDGYKSITIGDTLEATLEIYPNKEIVDPIHIMQLLEDGELGDFTIIHHGEVAASKNNNDVAVVDLRLVLRQAPKDGVIVIEYNKQPYALNLRKIEIDPSLQPHHYVLSQSLSGNGSLFLLMLIITFCILAVIGGFFFYKKRRQKMIEMEKRQNIISMIKNCDGRGDYENLYLQRKKWLPFVEEESTKDFLIELNNHQYKREWSKEILDIITEAYNKIEIKKDV